MNYCKLIILVMLFTACEDKVYEADSKIVSRPTVCPDTDDEYGPSPIQFNGVDDITNVTQSSATIHWEHVEGAYNYHVINIHGQDRKIIASTNAPANSVILKGLNANTTYNIIVRAIDEKGFIETNTNIASFVTAAYPHFDNKKSITLKGSQSIIFNRSSSYQNDNNFSLNLWFKMSQIRNKQRLFTFHQSAKSKVALSAKFDQQSLILEYMNSDKEIISLNTNFSYNDNKWHNLSVSISQTNIILYIDGIEMINENGELVELGDQYFHLGSKTGNEEALNGKIDELAFFNTALTRTDIENIYSNGHTQDLRNTSAGKSMTHWYRLGDLKDDGPITIEDVMSNQNGIPFNLSRRHFSNDVP